MMNQCPACTSALPEDNHQKGYCPVCGWEFITYLSPFEPGEKMLNERLKVTQQYFQLLREGSDEVKQKIVQLENELVANREILEEQSKELEELHQRNIRLEIERDEAITDQNYITMNQKPAGPRIALEYWADKDGIIHVESKEQVNMPPLMLVIKAGDVPIAYPKFGWDGTYAAMIHPFRWRERNATLFVLESNQMRRIFPCLSGNYTFSLASADNRYSITRKGKENDIHNITLKFSTNE